MVTDGGAVEDTGIYDDRHGTDAPNNDTGDPDRWCCTRVLLTTRDWIGHNKFMIQQSTRLGQL